MKFTHLNEMWLNSCRIYKDNIAFGVRHSEATKNQKGQITENSYFTTFTYDDVEKNIVAMGSGLASIGLKKQECVAVISENCLEWIISDFAILGNRSYNMPRGVSSTDDELIYMLNHSESRFAFVQDENELKRLLEIKEQFPKLETIIVFSRDFSPDPSLNQVFSFEQIIEKGKDKDAINLFNKRRHETTEDDIATLIYTSGTTGKPKGIPLTHKNLMHNIETIPFMGGFNQSDRFLSILPVWHIFEREFEYIELRVGASIWYSNKLTLLKDLQEVKPTYMASVPRIWLSVYNGVMSNLRNKGKEQLFQKLFVHSKKVIEAQRYKQNRQSVNIGFKSETKRASLLNHLFHHIADLLIYNKIRKKVGGAFKAGISGGGSLPGYIDDFFEAIGVKLLEGYGLTETSPILTARTFEHLVPYTAGMPLPDTQIRIMDEKGNEIKNSSKGVIWVNGPQVMKGYYKNEEETKKVMKIDDEGRQWFNTGDIGKRVASGDISLIGRSKNTIVLLGGENLEPEPIERNLLSSRYLEQVMVCGQDQEYLTSLVVPNEEALIELCNFYSVTFDKKDYLSLFNNLEIKKFFMDQINSIVSEENGFKDIERIHDFRFTLPFSPIDDTLTQTFKIKRFNVTTRDDELISSMYPNYNQNKKE